ncbi:unnamed protein product [Ectocarpus sp. CCAP 1310/34]|nr:unnamed protein product [Ectocarpus sp. CCAP 1310/34]
MNKLLELKPDALGGMPANVKPEEALAFKVKFNSWYQRFRSKRYGFSIRRRTSVGQKLSKGYEGMAWATGMKLREALVKRAGEIYARRHPPAPDESPIKGEDLTSEQLASVGAEVFEELGNMDRRQTSTRCRWRPLWRRPVRRMLASAQEEKSWSDQRECNGWIPGSWKLRPNNGSIVQQRPCILELDDFKCHKDEGFIAALKRVANTITIDTDRVGWRVVPTLRSTEHGTTPHPTLLVSATPTTDVTTFHVDDLPSCMLPPFLAMSFGFGSLMFFIQTNALDTWSGNGSAMLARLAANLPSFPSVRGLFVFTRQRLFGLPVVTWQWVSFMNLAPCVALSCFWLLLILCRRLCLGPVGAHQVDPGRVGVDHRVEKMCLAFNALSDRVAEVEQGGAADRFKGLLSFAIDDAVAASEERMKRVFLFLREEERERWQRYREVGKESCCGSPEGGPRAEVEVEAQPHRGQGSLIRERQASCGAFQRRRGACHGRSKGAARSSNRRP